MPTFEIFTVRTGGAIMMIGPPAAHAAARGDSLLSVGWEASLHIEMALEACGETHGIRQFCTRWGLDTHGAGYVDDRALRGWLVTAVRQGRLGVALLPDALVTGGTVQARAIATRARIALRIVQVPQPQGGARLEPIELIEALLRPAVPGAPPPAGAGERQAPREGERSPLANVRMMALDDRILEVIRRFLAFPEAAAGIAQQDLKVLVERDRLPDTVALLAAWADFHDGKVGSLTGLAVLAFGPAGLDGRTMSGLKALSRSLARTREARDPADLQEAAVRLARAIDLIGPARLQRLIAHSASLPVAMPVKTRAPSSDRTPTRPPAERYWPRPGLAPEKPKPPVELAPKSQQPKPPPPIESEPESAMLASDTDAEAQAQNLVDASEDGMAGCEECRKARAA